MVRLDVKEVRGSSAECGLKYATYNEERVHAGDAADRSVSLLLTAPRSDCRGSGGSSLIAWPTSSLSRGLQTPAQGGRGNNSSARRSCQPETTGRRPLGGGNKSDTREMDSVSSSLALFLESEKKKKADARRKFIYDKRRRSETRGSSRRANVELNTDNVPKKHKLSAFCRV